MKAIIRKDVFDEMILRRNVLQKDVAKFIDVSEEHLSSAKNPESGYALSAEKRERLLSFFNSFKGKRVDFDDIFFIQDS